jgi:hypothetical protein
MFTWLGAVVDIPYKVHKLLGTLGPKLYFFRLDRMEQTEDDYYNIRNESFTKKKQEIYEALHEYLTYFDMNPEAENNLQKEEEGLRKITMDVDKDDELADRVIIRVAKLLAHLRAIVPTWETKGTQGSEYAYTFAMVEDPSRAITQLRNLARGHALSQGRKYFTLDDIPLIIHTALSTATMERVRMFELLIANRGSLTTPEIVDFLNTTAPTARRTMTELKATGLVSMEIGEGQTPSKITLKPDFDWFLHVQFRLLKEKYPPQKEVSIPLSLPVLLYDHLITRNVVRVEVAAKKDTFTQNSPDNSHEGPFCGGKNSFCKMATVQDGNGASNNKPFLCWYCGLTVESLDEVDACCFETRDLLERHSINKHPRWPIDLGDADKEKYCNEVYQKMRRRQQI